MRGRTQGEREAGGACSRLFSSLAVASPRLALGPGVLCCAFLAPVFGVRTGPGKPFCVLLLISQSCSPVSERPHPKSPRRCLAVSLSMSLVLSRPLPPHFLITFSPPARIAQRSPSSAHPFISFVFFFLILVSPLPYSILLFLSLTPFLVLFILVTSASRFVLSPPPVFRAKIALSLSLSVFCAACCGATKQGVTPNL